jgi:Spy/CpxP family protein refolding chaperone
MNSLALRIAAAALLLVPSLSDAQDTTRTTVLRGSRTLLADTVTVLRGSRELLADSVMKENAAQDPAKAFADRLFPPELIMQHQAKLRITQAQRGVIVAEINKLQAAAVQMQWSVADEAQKLTELLDRETIAEAEALAQAERLIGYETAVKRAQLAMLIRIRNVLTPAQREMLTEVRGRSAEWAKRYTTKPPE